MSFVSHVNLSPAIILPDKLKVWGFLRGWYREQEIKWLAESVIFQNENYTCFAIRREKRWKKKKSGWRTGKILRLVFKPSHRECLQLSKRQSKGCQLSSSTWRGLQERRSEAPGCSGLHTDLGFGVPQDSLLLIASQFCSTPHMADCCGWLLITFSSFIAFCIHIFLEILFFLNIFDYTMHLISQGTINLQ